MQSPEASEKTRELVNKAIEESEQTLDEASSRERPQRLLIKIIQGFPHAIIHQICPFTAKIVRPIVKMPMVTLLITSGCVVALNLACFTFIGELL